ncbi:hypothetical protein, partial [Streptomyces aurantiacus]|uniref:hypothetical protein n=1 Tax=Streptomyces aurantiacus TaxID=47760 RepID=UPI0006E1FB64
MNTATAKARPPHTQTTRTAARVTDAVAVTDAVTARSAGDGRPGGSVSALEHAGGVLHLRETAGGRIIGYRGVRRA